MPSTIPYKRGEIVLVEFPFTDLSGRTRRPAVVLSDNSFNQSGTDRIVAQITSNINAHRLGDHIITEWQQAGLPKPSVVRTKLATLATSKITKALGIMPDADMLGIEANIRTALGL